MIRYQEICEANKTLYEAMECLTNQINACLTSESAEKLSEDILRLKIQRSRIKDLVNINLDKIEEIWRVNDYSYRRANWIVSNELPDDLEQAIISSYVLNPNRPQHLIGDEFNLTVTVISRVLTKYLTQKFSMEAAPT